MSAEQKELLRSLSSRATNKGEITVAFNYLAHVNSEIREQCDKGTMKVEAAVDRIGELFEIFYADCLRVESAAWTEYAREKGFETLTTDTHDARSAEWFERTGTPFATGIASNCIVCAIINPDVGMAASHRNTVTKGDYKRFMRRLLEDKRLRKVSLDSPFGYYVSPSSLSSSVSIATNQAFDEFSKLAPNGIPPQGTSIYFTGLDYLSEPQIQPVIDIANRTISKRVATEGKMLGVKKTIDMEFGTIGKVSGVVYGGKNHPVYSTPQFYDVR